MAHPDYAAVLDRVPDVSPHEIADLLLTAAAPLGGRDITLLLSDLQGLVLQPVLREVAPGGGAAEEPVDASMAGRSFRTGLPVTAERGDGVRVWVPLVERAERTGVLALTVSALTDEVLADCVRLGRFAGLLARSFARTTDLMHLSRRRRPMTLAAGMQWDLLPPLTVRGADAIACGRLEPAYEVAGDAFDYVVNGRHLHAALFDGMGHGVESTIMTTLAVGAYRHARRAGAGLEDVREAVDRAIARHYPSEGFVTAALIRLDLDAGLLEWTCAGHPAPLHMRRRRVVGELLRDPSLPLGLGGKPAGVASEPLEPGDSVLFFTDGAVEGRSSGGAEFGVAGLADAWEREAASDQPPDEVLRRVVEMVVGHSEGSLRDDASLLLLAWRPDQPSSPTGPSAAAV